MDRSYKITNYMSDNKLNYINSTITDVNTTTENELKWINELQIDDESYAKQDVLS